MFTSGELFLESFIDVAVLVQYWVFCESQNPLLHCFSFLYLNSLSLGFYIPFTLSALLSGLASKFQKCIRETEVFRGKVPASMYQNCEMPNFRQPLIKSHWLWIQSCKSSRCRHS